MPSLFRFGKYIVFFWSNENNEPIHVHVCEGSAQVNATKIWLTSSGGCVVANNNSKISQHDINKILEIVSAQFFLICSSWKSHFKVDDIKFYC